jgi:Tfp pilus assembly protein PilN
VRPVNLIPREERRGEQGPARTGPTAYVVVGALALALLALTLVVLTNNKIADRKAEKTSLESQVAAAQEEADRLKSFADFASVQQAREVTVTSLARSRFDWEQVLRELAIVIPSDVWLIDLSAKVSPGVQLASSSSSASGGTGAAGVSGTDGVTGPSLEISGCAASHEAVARFLAALRDVDGVTRASVLSSDLPDPATTSESSSSTASSTTCATRKFISQFRIAAAFDAVAVPAAATAPVTPAAPAASTADQSQVTDGQQELDQQRQSATQQTQKARNDVNTFVPGTGSGQ